MSLRLGKNRFLKDVTPGVIFMKNLSYFSDINKEIYLNFGENSKKFYSLNGLMY